MRKLDDFIYMFEKVYSILRDRPPLKRLIKEGMTVGDNIHIQNGVYFDLSHAWLISIGNNVTFAPHVHVLAHDASTKMFLNYTRIGKVNIGNNVFIGANSTILPNVNIGSNVIVGANSLVNKDIPSNSVYAGNPAKEIYKLDEYLEKEKLHLGQCVKFDKTFTRKHHVSKNMKLEMKKELENNEGFVE